MISLERKNNKNGENHQNSVAFQCFILPDIQTFRILRSKYLKTKENKINKRFLFLA